jgi:hypothetical protein
MVSLDNLFDAQGALRLLIAKYPKDGSESSPEILKLMKDFCQMPGAYALVQNEMHLGKDSPVLAPLKAGVLKRLVSDANPLPPEEVANWEAILASNGFTVNPKSLNYLLKVLDSAERSDNRRKQNAARGNIENMGIELDAKDLKNFYLELNKFAATSPGLKSTIKEIIYMVRLFHRALGPDYEKTLARFNAKKKDPLLPGEMNGPLWENVSRAISHSSSVGENIESAIASLETYFKDKKEDDVLVAVYALLDYGEPAVPRLKKAYSRAKDAGQNGLAKIIVDLVEQIWVESLQGSRLPDDVAAIYRSSKPSDLSRAEREAERDALLHINAAGLFFALRLHSENGNIAKAEAVRDAIFEKIYLASLPELAEIKRVLSSELNEDTKSAHLTFVLGGLLPIVHQAEASKKAEAAKKAEDAQPLSQSPLPLPKEFLKNNSAQNASGNENKKKPGTDEKKPGGNRRKI